MLTTLLILALCAYAATAGAGMLAMRYAPEPLQRLFSCPFCLSYWATAAVVLGSGLRVVEAPALIAAGVTWLASAACVVLLLKATGVADLLGEAAELRRLLGQARQDLHEMQGHLDLARDELRAIADGLGDSP